MPKSKDQSAAGFDQWRERLKEAGFLVGEENDRVRISKHGCAAVLEAFTAGEPRFAVRPGLLIRAATVSERPKDHGPEQETSQPIAHLVDRGFQKFWQEDERLFPALAAQLHALHRFDQDLRAVTGLTALYNEALGSVSSRYVYDRLEGREKGKRHQAF